MSSPPEHARELGQRRRLAERQATALADPRDREHQADRQQQPWHHARQKQRADRRAAEDRVDHHRDRWRDDRAETRRSRGDRDREACGVVADLAHHLDRHHAGARRVAHRAAGHAGNDDVHQHRDVTEACAQPSDRSIRRGPDPLRNGRRIHGIAGQDEHRDGQQHVELEARIERLVDDQADVLPAHPQIDKPATEHHQRDGEAQHREHDERRAHQQDRIGGHPPVSPARWRARRRAQSRPHPANSAGPDERA